MLDARATASGCRSEIFAYGAVDNSTLQNALPLLFIYTVLQYLSMR